MGKRLTKFEYIISLVIVLLIAANVGSFIFGVEYGADRMETHYLKIINEGKKPDRSKDSYHIEHIVSYYYNVYEPMRNFEKLWFRLYEPLAANQSVSDLSEQLSDLNASAGKEYDRIQSITMPASSSFLVDGQKNAMKSLALFRDLFGNVNAATITSNSNTLLSAINKDPNYVAAREFALLSRQQYFTAIVEWNKTVNAGLEGTSLLNKKDLAFADWKSLNLNLKNQFITQLLSGSKTYTLALPMDFVSRIDDLIARGETATLNAKTVGQLLEKLIATRAVENGEFVLVKDRLYSKEFLPKLPFYSTVD